MSEITIRGRIATVHLARGETAVVEHTDTIDRLIAGGWVEAVAPLPPAQLEPEPVEEAPEAAQEPEAPTDGEPEAETEAVARRKPSRRKASS